MVVQSIQGLLKCGFHVCRCHFFTLFITNTAEETRAISDSTASETRAIQILLLLLLVGARE
jgi:hypothetical protein